MRHETIQLTPRRKLVALVAAMALAGCGASEKTASTERVNVAKTDLVDTTKPKQKVEKQAPKPTEEDPFGQRGGDDTNYDEDPEIHMHNVLQALCNVPTRGTSHPAPKEETARELLTEFVELMGDDVLPGGVSVEDFSKALDDAHLTKDAGNSFGEYEENITPETEIPQGVPVDFSFDESCLTSEGYK